MSTYCFTAILVNSGAYGQMDPLVKDVVVIGPNKSGSVILEAPGDNPSADSISPVGHGLLHFYGCVTCHELPLPPFRGRWGPDLDTIGSKTTVAWLNQSLEDPEAVNHRSKMPRVLMSNDTRSQIVQLLQTFGVVLPKPVYSERLDGAALYKRGDCRACHKRDGIGGDRGPLLDGIQKKISKPWLVAYLLNPNSLVANSRMPLFEWEPEEASALATYLVGAGVTIDSAPTRKKTDVARAAALASELGCFQSHRVSKLSLTLDLPNQESAAGYIGYHAKGDAGIKLHLATSEVKSMTAALFTVNGRGLSDADFLSGFWETPIPLQGLAPATTTHRHQI